MNTLDQFATNEAIQITEIFEYVQKLSDPNHVLHSFLYYKFLYAIRLLDFGLCDSALHYLEELAQALVKIDPNDIDEDVKTNLHKILYLADKLKYLDPMYTTREGEVSDMGDPFWLNDLRNMVEGRLHEQTQQQQLHEQELKEQEQQLQQSQQSQVQGKMI